MKYAYLDDTAQKMERFNMMIESDLLSRLRSRAEELNTTVSALIRLYCVNGLERGRERTPSEDE